MFLRLNELSPAIMCPLTIPNQSDVSVGGVARPLGYFSELKVIITLHNCLWLLCQSGFSSNTIVSPDLKVLTDLSSCLKLWACVWLFGQT
jgi:hypothetical protein